VNGSQLLARGQVDDQLVVSEFKFGHIQSLAQMEPFSLGRSPLLVALESPGRKMFDFVHS
jgi:hypothetical protein